MRMRQRSILALALVIVASLFAGGVAQAHNLPAKYAKKGARTVAKQYAQAFANNGDTDVRYGTGKCSQRTAHRWVCKFYVEGVDDNGPYLCRGFAIVRTTSATANTYTATSQNEKLACVQ